MQDNILRTYLDQTRKESIAKGRKGGLRYPKWWRRTKKRKK